MSLNQHVAVEYPCGCRWAFPMEVVLLPRNCPDHWPADKGYKLEPEAAAPATEKDGGEHAKGPGTT